MWSQDKIQPHSQPLKLGGAINLLGASWAVAKIGLFLKMIRTCQGKWTKILQRLHKHMFCYIQNNQIFHWNVIKMRLNLLFHLNSTQLISHFYRKKLKNFNRFLLSEITQPTMCQFHQQVYVFMFEYFCS